MDKSTKSSNEWYVNDEELIFQSPSLDTEPEGFELADTELKFSDLMSDGDIFGAEIRHHNRPTDGYWSEIIDNPSFFADFDLIYSDHEIIISDGDSVIYDTSIKDTAIFSKGPEVEIHASQKSLDLFVEIDQNAVVHSENSSLNIFTFEESSGHTKVMGSLKSLNLNIYSENDNVNQALQVVDEKLIYGDSGKTIVDLKNLDLAIVDINVTFLNSSGVDGTDTVTLFLDGPEREIVTDTIPRLDQLVFEEEMEISYAHSVEVQLFGSNRLSLTDSEQQMEIMGNQQPEYAVATIENQTAEAVDELAISQDLLGQDSLFEDPLDILFYDE